MNMHNILLVWLPYVGAALATAITILYAKKQIKQSNPEVWPVIQPVVWGSTSLFIYLAGTFRRNFLSMAGSSSGSIIEDIGIELSAATLVAMVLGLLWLWYKGLLKVQYVKIYVLSYLLGLVSLAVYLAIYVLGVKYIF